MISVRRTLLLLLLLMACAAVLFFGIHDYLLISGSAALSSGELKLRAEGVLFLSIVFAGLILLAVGFILLRSRNISRELDKIIDLARHGSFSFEENLKRIGVLGDKIRSLNQQLTELNEMKTLRISSLAGINAFLLNNIRFPLLITDITGKVTGSSPRLLEKLKAERPAVVGRHIKEALPELDFQAVVSKLEKQRTELLLDEAKKPATFYPVFNRRNELSNIICILGREEVVSEVRKFAEERAKSVSRVTNLFRRYLGSRRRRQKE